jgi:hypothetical protein
MSAGGQDKGAPLSAEEGKSYCLSVNDVPNADGSKSQWTGVYRFEDPSHIETMARCLDGTEAYLSAFEVESPVAPAKFAREGDTGALPRLKPGNRVVRVDGERNLHRWHLPDALKGRVVENAVPTIDPANYQQAPPSVDSQQSPAAQARQQS